MIAVADVQIVVDVVVGDREIVRGIVDTVVAEMVDLVLREQRVVGRQRRAGRTFSMCDPVIEMQVV